jgi:hypothetical protein
MDKRKILEQYYNNENNEEKNDNQSEIKRKEILEQYYNKNKDLNDENVELKYIGLVFADVILLNIMVALGFEIFANLNDYGINLLFVIILWVIDVFVLALFLKTVSQTIKCLKKM